MSARAQGVSSGEKLTTEEMLREASRLQAETIYLQAQRNLEQARRGTAGEPLALALFEGGANREPGPGSGRPPAN
jgi:hypothetical protein